MKMTLQHISILKNAIRPLNTPERVKKYLCGNFKNSDKVRDLNMRYRWDLLHASGVKIDQLYTYLDDTHIDSALRHLVADITK
jgi:hypothetical protein